MDQMDSRGASWLHQLIGKWSYEGPCAAMDGSGERSVTSGTEQVRALGDIWVVSNGFAKMEGFPVMEYVATYGYDAARKIFHGTWIGAGMPALFVYEGSLNADGTILTLDTEGPDLNDPSKRAQYQDSIEVLGPDRRILRSRQLLEDGGWFELLEGRYKRVD